MAWTETRPGYWQRPIGENEAMIKMIGEGGRQVGKDVWSISVTASFIAHVEKADRAEYLAHVLCDGWKVLRFYHPSIASTASEDTLEYHVPNSIELEQWAVESFVVMDGVGPDDLIADLRLRRFATLYYLREHASVVLHLSHWRTDGIGALHLLNAYFQAVVESLEKDPFELPWGEEATRLTPSVERALSLPSTPSPDIERAAKQYLDTLAHNTGALSTPYKSEEGIFPKGTRSTHVCLSQDATAELRSECRRLDVRLEAAVHASVTAAAYSIADPTSRQQHHSSTLRHSLRPHLPPPYDGKAGAAGLYTAGYIVKVPASQSWLENAKEYEAEYSKGATPDLLSSRRQYAATMKGILKNMPSSANPPPSGLDISCIPDVEALVKAVHTSEVGSLEIRSIGVGVDVLSRHLYVFTFVFNSQLELRMVYNEAFYNGSLAESILHLVKKHLVSNLLSSSSKEPR